MPPALDLNADGRIDMSTAGVTGIQTPGEAILWAGMNIQGDVGDSTGSIVEISLDEGTSWTQVMPIDGYPYLAWYEGDLNVGLPIYAAGFPLGDPEFTLTRGIVSKERASGETSWASIDYVIEQNGDLAGVIGIGGFLGLGEYTVAVALNEFETRMVEDNDDGDEWRQYEPVGCS